MNRNRPIQRFVQYKPGYETTILGWKLTLQSDHAVKLENPAHSDLATIVGTDPLTGPVMQYNKAELVPRSVRIAVKVLARKSLAREQAQA